MDNHNEAASATGMNGKTCLITGATNGIGKPTALALAQQGATVVLVARNTELAESVKNEMIAATGNPKIEVLGCDLASFLSIMYCCEEFKKRHNKLDVLINNAGVWESRRRLSRDGVEMTFAVNHLAPFLMTNLLLDLLKQSSQQGSQQNSPSRIITVASGAHTGGTINFNDLEGKHQFNSFQAYAQSKLANILFTKKLARVLQASDGGANVTANCLHPGVVNTNLFNKLPKIVGTLGQWFMKTPEKGAQTSIYLASSPEVASISGEYFDKKKIARSSKLSNDEATADRLWEISLQYVGL